MIDSSSSAQTQTSRSRRTLRQRLWSTFLNVRWLVLGVLWVFALSLGYRGFYEYYQSQDTLRSVSDLVYLTIQLVPLQSGALPPPIPVSLDIARFLAPALAGYTAFRAILVLFDRQFQGLRLRFLSNHVVICGLGQIGSRLAEAFQQQGSTVVVIEADDDHPLLQETREQGIIVLPADATEPKQLAKARTQHAQYVFAVLGDDAANLQVAQEVRRTLLLDPARVLTCVTHITDVALYSRLKAHELMADQPHVRQEFINIYDNGAQEMLSRYPPFGNTGANTTPHILMVGIGRFGEQVVVRIAHQWQRSRYRTSGCLPMTIIDRRAGAKCPALLARHPQVADACDMTVLEMDVASAEFERGAFLSAPLRPPVTVAYVCLDDDSLSLTSGLTLQEHSHAHPFLVVVRVLQEGGLGVAVQNALDHGVSLSPLAVFGVLDATSTPSMLLGRTHEILAQAIHAEYCQFVATLPPAEREGRAAMPWQDLPEHLKESNRRQAGHIGAKLKSVGRTLAPIDDVSRPEASLTDAEVNTLARMEHERWVRERYWARYSPSSGVRDIHARLSPALKTWDELIDEERAFDRNFVRTLPRVLAQVGLRIVRE